MFPAFPHWTKGPGPEEPALQRKDRLLFPGRVEGKGKIAGSVAWDEERTSQCQG